MRSHLSERRKKLSALLAGAPIVLGSGLPRSRNYPALHYPFRCSSHFLYLFGTAPSDAYVVLADGVAELFIEPPTPTDAIWHGAVDLSALKERGEFNSVRPLSELRSALEKVGRSRVLSLPFPDLASNERLSSFLGRYPDISAADRPLADALIALRLIHDDFAKQQLRDAAAVTAAAFASARNLVQSGCTEWDVSAALMDVGLRQGLDLAYPPIVTVCGEVLHGAANGAKLQRGDLLLVDFGFEARAGYASDVTRTWAVDGQASSVQREAHAAVLAAQQKAISLVRPGAAFRDIHLAACSELTAGLVSLGLLRGNISSLVERGAHALFFPHGIGHLLGLDVHDLEDLGDLAGYAAGRTRSEQFGLNNLRLDRELVPGMCVTIEPGLYNIPAMFASGSLADKFSDCLVREHLPRLSEIRGIRIEDNLLVSASGAENLTSPVSKEL